MTISYIQFVLSLASLLAHHAEALRQEKPVLRELLDLHNIYRSFEDSADIQLLVWDANLVSLAAKWAAKCEYTDPNPKTDKPYFHMGVLFHATPGKIPDIHESVYTWYKEKRDYNYKNAKCGDGYSLTSCRRYKQLVWEKVNRLGCAYQYCRDMYLSSLKDVALLVCVYARIKRPILNTGPRPYVKGTACSKCSDGKGWCDRGLCNSRCREPGQGCRCMAICRNCATLDMESCTCKCARGWTGADCGEVCKPRQFCRPALNNLQPAPNLCPPIHALRIQRRNDFEKWLKRKEKGEKSSSAAAGIVVQNMFTGQHFVMTLMTALLAPLRVL